MKKIIIYTLFICGVVTQVNAQEGLVKGTVFSNGKKLDYLQLNLQPLNKKAVTNANGNFQFQNIPFGNYTLYVAGLGFKQKKISLEVNTSEPINLEIDLEESENLLNAVVVTGTRTQKRRLESAVAVNILDSKTFNNTVSNTLADGLCFQPGLRMETDCQTCNYTQLRMNGMGGSYTQTLINSRPIFSSLMSLYGLEQIPANMIDRVEIVRGGGSVLYGSSAIAGTVNIITKEPKSSSFTIANQSAVIGGRSFDNFLNLNANVINEENNAGVSFFASRRDRTSYDANGDGFSELPLLKNNSFGLNSFLKINDRSRLDINAWSINEERKGGNKLDLQSDKADQAEYRLHYILAGGFNYNHQFGNKNSSLSFYSSGQNTKRTHYTGIDGIDGWGNTKNYSIQSGFQYNYIINDFFKGKNTLTTGIENQYEYTFDEIKAYDYLIDQNVNLTGFFAQSDWELSPKFTVLSGLRLNKSNRINKLVFTPRLSTLYKLNNNIQLRASYARGFKAPQALETDMHIAFAGGGVSVIKIADDLKEETSNSFNASIDMNVANEHFIYGFTLDGFFTRLNHTFILEEIGTDANGNQQLLRSNGSAATVKGITLEGRFNYDQLMQLETGATLQKSYYKEAVSWSADLPGNRRFLRTPNVYGYYTLTFLPKKAFNATLSGVFTGNMLVPHFGGAPGINADVVNNSRTFLEQHLKLAYTFNLKKLKQDLQFNLGMQNIFNQYQNDFDIGKNRDSNYIYGPSKPRTIFAGIKFGLL